MLCLLHLLLLWPGPLWGGRLSSNVSEYEEIVQEHMHPSLSGPVDRALLANDTQYNTTLTDQGDESQNSTTFKDEGEETNRNATYEDQDMLADPSKYRPAFNKTALTEETNRNATYEDQDMLEDPSKYRPAFNKTALTEETNRNATYEDQENFQDQESFHHYHHCNESLLERYSDSLCVRNLHFAMADIGQVNWCNWEMVKRPYNRMSMCMEDLAPMLGCYYPNSVVQGLFHRVHRDYFLSCPSPDEDLTDPPPGLALVLTLIPVCQIPLLVCLVLYKSKIGD